MMKRSLASFLGLFIVAFISLAQTPSAPSQLVILANQGGASGGSSGDALLTWDAEALATGYTVFWGSVSGPPYANSDDVGNVTSADASDLSGLSSGTYYFAIASYDESGLHGPYSDEIVVVVP